jgi:hypothetical protein
MKKRFLCSVIIVLLFIALYVPSSFSANPAFNIILKNDVLAGDVFEFDVYAQSTASDPIQLAGVGLAFQFNTSALNGGTVTASIVPNSSELSNTSQIPESFVYSVSGLQTIVIIPAMIPPGNGNGSMLSTINPGTKLYRLRLTNSNSWIISGTNLIDITTSAQYPISFTAYVSGSNTIIGANRTVLNEFTGTLLPVELSSFASTSQGRNVSINWSTQTEKNSDRFEVERTLQSSTSWSTIASVKAAGLSNSPKSYSYSDAELQSGKYQYRLKMIDNDGSYEYSRIENTEVAIPKDFAISQNYPNPFNPSTKIDYQLPADAKILIDIYNIVGQKLVELVNREQSAGYYTVDFGASELASGIYIYRLAASDKVTGKSFSLVKKMILLK